MPRWVKCCSCGKSFNPTTAKEDYNDITDYWLYDYDKFKQWYCPECANQKVEDMEEDFYYDTCEKCGKQFDVLKDAFEIEGDFKAEGDDDDTTYYEVADNHGILCRDCMLDAFIADKEERESDEYYEDDDDDDEYDPYIDDEADAARSRGYDEEYGWKHSTEELKKH